MDDPIVRITALLDRLKVPYCLIGGYAVAAHGVPRHTADVDLLVILPQGDIAALASLLQEAGLEVEVARADRSDPLGGVITILQEVPAQLLVPFRYLGLITPARGRTASMVSSRLTPLSSSTYCAPHRPQQARTSPRYASRRCR